MSYLINNHLKEGYSDYNLLFLKRYNTDLNLDNTILDVGCGHYRNLYLFYQLGFKKLHGIDRLVPDPSEKPKRFNVNFIKKDITIGLPYEDKAFDIVLCNFVLMFIPPESLLEVIGDLLRVTKEFCIIETQNQFYKAKNSQIVQYKFKDIIKYIENRNEFEILDRKIYKEKLMIRRISNG